MYEEQYVHCRLAKARPGHRIIMRESSVRRVQEQGRIRLLCVALVFALSFMAIGSRIAEIAFDQLLISSDKIHDEAAVNSRLTVQAFRSDILDRNGEVIATTLSTKSAFARPRVMLDISNAAAKLSAALPDLNSVAGAPLFISSVI